MRFIELEEDRTCCFKYITMVCRVMGLVVVVFLYIMMASILTEEKYHTINGWYLLAITLLITFLETLWLFDKCNCCNDMSCCCMVWRAIKWVDCWRKTLLYVALPIPLFMRNTDSSASVLKAVVAGVMLLALGALYFVKSFRNTACAKSGATARTYAELQGQASSQQVAPSGGAAAGAGGVPAAGAVPQQQPPTQLVADASTGLTVHQQQQQHGPPPRYTAETAGEKSSSAVEGKAG